MIKKNKKEENQEHQTKKPQFPWSPRRLASGLLAFAMTVTMVPPPVHGQEMEIIMDDGVGMQVLASETENLLRTTYVDGVEVDGNSEPDTLPPVPGMTPGGTTPTTPSHWAEEYLDKMVEYGYLREELAGDPDELLTRAEFMAVINRAYNYTQMGAINFEDVTIDDWFYDDVAIATKAGFITGTSESTAEPLGNMTREMTSYILGKNLMLPEMSGENMIFSDANDISEWSRGLVKSTAHYGLVNGYSDGTFRPTESITRGELAVLVLQAIGTPVQVTGDVVLEEVWGNVTITESGTALKNTMVAGDLYISNGIGLGGATLENVTVLGRLVITGGESEQGDASIILRNVIAPQLIVDNMDKNLLTVRVEGDSYIAKSYVRTNAYVEDNTSSENGLQHIYFEAEPGTTVDVAGRIKEVTNISPGTFLRVVSGSVDVLNLDESAPETSTEIMMGAVVHELNVDVSTNVTGDGDVGSANVNASDVVIEMLPDDIVIRPGVDAEINGEIMNSTTAEEFSSEPRILAGYPIASDIAPNSFTALFKTNKPGTVYYAVSNITQGSVPEDDLLLPPSYGGVGLIYGSVSILEAETEIQHLVDGLEIGGSYYLTAILEDSRGDLSPVKVIAFTTPDNSIPEFAEGYPYMTSVTHNTAQVTVMATKSCKLYYAVLPAGSLAPTGAEFLAGAVTGSEGSGIQDLIKNQDATFTVSNSLQEMKDYELYLWLTDADGMNFSEVVMLEFTTKDGTPPVFNQNPEAVNVGTNSVDFNFSINEDGTVYWIAVLAGTMYPKVSPTDTSGNVTEPWYTDYAKLQVAQGMNGGIGAISGSMDAQGNTTHTFTLAGLELETSYDLYYVAKDLAGNYSESIGMLTFNTLDNTAPEFIEQQFSHVATPSNPGEGVIAQPYATTNITLVFSEGIQSTYFEGTTGQSFLQLYTAVTTATSTEAKATARNNLAAALENAITLYKWNGNSSTEVLVRNAENATDGDVLNGEWVIDYRYATITLTGGQMLLTFPTIEANDRAESALNLSAGVTYGFKLKNIQDSSFDANIMVPAELTLDRFTTIYAEVMFGPASVMTELPNRRQPNGKVDTGKWVELDDDLRITPGPMTNVDPDVVYEIRFNPNVDVSFNIYYRLVDEKGKFQESLLNLYPTYPGIELANRLNNFDDRKERIINSWEPDDYGWILLSVDNVATTHNEKFETAPTTIQGNGDGIGIGFNYGFLGYQGATVYPALASLSDEYQIEMVFEVTSFQGSTVRGEWNGELSVDTQMYAGNYSYIRSLGPHGSVADDVYNNISLVSTPSEYTIGRTYTDSLEPELGFGAPQAFTEDITTEVEVSFDGSRVGTLYYALTRASYPNNLNPMDADGNPVSIDAIPDIDSDLFVAGMEWPSPALTELSSPSYNVIVNRTDSNPSWFGSIEGMTNSSKVIAFDGLEPQTTYYLYIVTISDNGGGYSTPKLYKFTTEDTERPKFFVESTDPTTADVNFSTHVDSQSSWLMMTASDATKYIPMLNDSFFEYLNNKKQEKSTVVNSETGDYYTYVELYLMSPYWENKDSLYYNPGGSLIPDSTVTPYTIYDLLKADYHESGDNYDHPEFSSSGYTGFDIFASTTMKDEFYSAMIEVAVGIVAKGSGALTADEINTVVRNPDSGASPDASYVIFFTGMNQNADSTLPKSKTHSFRLKDNFTISDLNAPTLIDKTEGIVASVNPDLKPEDGVFPTAFTGTLDLTFDKYLYTKSFFPKEETKLLTIINEGDEATLSEDYINLVDAWHTNKGTGAPTTANIGALSPLYQNAPLLVLNFDFEDIVDGATISLLSAGQVLLSNKNGVTRDAPNAVLTATFKTAEKVVSTVTKDDGSTTVTTELYAWWYTNWDGDWGSDWNKDSNTIPDYATKVGTTVVTTGGKDPYVTVTSGTGYGSAEDPMIVYAGTSGTAVVKIDSNMGVFEMPTASIKVEFPTNWITFNPANNTMTIEAGAMTVGTAYTGGYVTFKHSSDKFVTLYIDVLALDPSELEAIADQSTTVGAAVSSTISVLNGYESISPNITVSMVRDGATVNLLAGTDYVITQETGTLNVNDTLTCPMTFTPLKWGTYTLTVSYSTAEAPISYTVTVPEPTVVLTLTGETAPLVTGATVALTASAKEFAFAVTGAASGAVTYNFQTSGLGDSTLNLNLTNMPSGMAVVSLTDTFEFDVPFTATATVGTDAFVYSLTITELSTLAMITTTTGASTMSLQTYGLEDTEQAYDMVYNVNKTGDHRIEVTSAFNAKEFTLTSSDTSVVTHTSVSTNSSVKYKPFKLTFHKQGEAVLTLTDNITGEETTILVKVN